jgi:lipopolysaccharide export system ATP-binding protein
MYSTDDRDTGQVLGCTNIYKAYKKRTVVNGISIHVQQGEIVGLLGPNGAGKTTTFYTIVGLIKPDQGSVYLNGADISHLPMYKRARQGLGYLAQEPSVFRNLSVRDNINTILEFSTFTRSERIERIDELLSEFHLEAVANNKGYMLSGGERRRTEIARALASNPSFLLLDEPFAGVDPIAVEDLQRIVYKLKQKNIGILITDHNVHETLAIADRAYLMYEGNILKEGSATHLAEDEEARKTYLGSQFKLDRYSPLNTSSHE